MDAFDCSLRRWRVLKELTAEPILASIRDFFFEVMPSGLLRARQLVRTPKVSGRLALLQLLYFGSSFACKPSDPRQQRTSGAGWVAAAALLCWLLGCWRADVLDFKGALLAAAAAAAGARTPSTSRYALDCPTMVHSGLTRDHHFH